MKGSFATEYKQLLPEIWSQFDLKINNLVNMWI